MIDTLKLEPLHDVNIQSVPLSLWCALIGVAFLAIIIGEIRGDFLDLAENVWIRLKKRGSGK